METSVTSSAVLPSDFQGTLKKYLIANGIDPVAAGGCSRMDILQPHTVKEIGDGIPLGWVPRNLVEQFDEMIKAAGVKYEKIADAGNPPANQLFFIRRDDDLKPENLYKLTDALAAAAGKHTRVNERNIEEIGTQIRQLLEGLDAPEVLKILRDTVEANKALGAPEKQALMRTIETATRARATSI